MKDPVDKLRKSPVTIGIFFAILGALLALATFIVKGKMALGVVVDEAIEKHQTMIIEKSHPDIPSKFTYRLEHERSLGQISSDIRSIKETLERLQRDFQSHVK